VAIARQARVADGVDAGVDAMQTAGGHASAHCASAQSEVDELAEGHHSVLRGRELGDQPFQAGVWRDAAV
jgi:hypothetical protein